MIVETSDALLKCSRMWERLGNALERRAHDQLNTDMSSVRREYALADAKAAEACFWRATGEEDCMKMKVREDL